MKRTIHNQKGVAILLVLTSVAFLTYILTDFSFETKINKLRIYNRQDIMQAKLNAQSGLELALAKLDLYRVAKNKLESSQGASSFLSSQQLQSLITAPFIYPIPIKSSAGLGAKEALKKFEESSLLRGGLTLEMSPANGVLNPNLLRVPVTDESRQDPYARDRDDPYADDEDKEDKPVHEAIEEEFVDFLTREIERKSDQDLGFAAKNSALDPLLLVKELKYFVNDKDTLNDPEIPQIEVFYSDKQIRPKFGPMNSISELYLLAGWPNELIDLVKDSFTVHKVRIIPLNQINAQQLRLLIPDLTEEMITEFFLYRDGGQREGSSETLEPHPFESVDGFKNAVTRTLALTDMPALEKRIDTLKAAGISLGVAGELFQVSSVGGFNRAKYSLSAIVSLPPMPDFKEEARIKLGLDDDDEDDRDGARNGQDNQNNNISDNRSQEKEKDKEKPTELRAPRVVEIFSGPSL